MKINSLVNKFFYNRIVILYNHYLYPFFERYILKTTFNPAVCAAVIAIVYIKRTSFIDTVYKLHAVYCRLRGNSETGKKSLQEQQEIEEDTKTGARQEEERLKQAIVESEEKRREECATEYSVNIKQAFTGISVYLQMLGGKENFSTLSELEQNLGGAEGVREIVNLSFNLLKILYKEIDAFKKVILKEKIEENFAKEKKQDFDRATRIAKILNSRIQCLYNNNPGHSLLQVLYKKGSPLDKTIQALDLVKQFFSSLP